MGEGKGNCIQVVFFIMNNDTNDQLNNKQYQDINVQAMAASSAKKRNNTILPIRKIRMHIGFYKFQFCVHFVNVGFIRDKTEKWFYEYFWVSYKHILGIARHVGILCIGIDIPLYKHISCRN